MLVWRFDLKNGVNPRLPAPARTRDLRLDFFRGVALVFIFVDHIPENILSYFTLQAVGFYDAAEVFIFISGFTAALVYGQRMAVKGALYATAQIWRRAWQLYVAHVFLFVIFIGEVSYTVMTFNNPMYNEEMRVADFLVHPHIAVIKALLLEFQPTFLDILPLYILMMLIFPAVLADPGPFGAGLSRGRDLVLQPAGLAVPVHFRGGAGAELGAGRVAAGAEPGADAGRDRRAGGGGGGAAELDPVRAVGRVSDAPPERAVAGQQD